MIDARGLSCPMPVVMTQKAIQKGAPASLEVLVDAQVAVENPLRPAPGLSGEGGAPGDGL